MPGLDPAAWAALYARNGAEVLPLHTIHNGACSCRRQCGSPGKHPLTKHGKDDSSSDPGQIAAWWRRWPWANVGIRPPDGVIVLDVDRRASGGTTLLGLTREHTPLPRTRTAWTGGAGLHVWLDYTGPVRGQLCQGVDVKTSSGYVVAPPSLHLSGRRYEWANDAPTARAPGWVRQLLAPPAAPSSEQAPTSDRHTAGDALVRVVEDAPEGARNARLYWAACRAHERGADPALLHALAAAGEQVGLTWSEVSRTLASAARTTKGGVPA